MALQEEISVFLLVAAASACAQPATLPTYSGFPIELHMTELGPGAEPHPPHHHAHDDLVLLRSVKTLALSIWSTL